MADGCAVAMALIFYLGIQTEEKIVRGSQLIYEYSNIFEFLPLQPCILEIK